MLDGVAFGQPAVALAAKLGSRAAAFGLDVPPPEPAAADAVSGTEDGTATGTANGTATGAGTGVAGEPAAVALFRIAYAAGACGEDPETALRAVARAHAAALAAAQRAAG